jgi:hypothetical protein
MFGRNKTMTKKKFHIFCAMTITLFVFRESFAASGQNSASCVIDAIVARQSADSGQTKGSTSTPEARRSQQSAEETTADAIGHIAAVEPASPSKTKSGASEEATSPQGSSPDKWQFQFVPYLWFAGIKGQVGIGDRVADVDADFGDIFDRLNFGFMAALEARKGKFLLLSDLLYLKVSAENATPGALFSSVKATQKVFMFEEDAGYRLLEKNGSSLDAFAGIRFWHLHTRLLFTPGISPELEVSGSKNWVDGIAGLRGRAYVSKNVFVFGKGDAGGGGSDLTYQLLGGAGLTFRERFSFVLAYRYLHVNYDRDNFLFDVGIKGPAIGFGIKF